MAMNQRIVAALAESGGKVKGAAERLGVPRRTMDRWVTKAGARHLVSVDHNKGGGRPRGRKPPSPRMVQVIDPDRRVRVERECEGGGEFISLKDALGNMVTIKFTACVGGGSAKGDGRGRLADLIVRPDGKSQCEFIAAEIQASSAEERKRRVCLENAIARICGPQMAARIQEEARRQP